MISWKQRSHIPFETNSVIHKAAGSLATARSQKATGRNAPRGHSCWRLPFIADGTFFRWNAGTMESYQSNYGTAGNLEASGFVNSAVNVLYCSFQLDELRPWACELWVNQCENMPIGLPGPEGRRSELIGGKTEVLDLILTNPVSAF